MDINVKITSTVKSLIDSHDITAFRLAKGIGVSPGDLNPRLSNKARYTPDMLDKIAAYFNVSTDYLMGRNIEIIKPVITNYNIPVYASVQAGTPAEAWNSELFEISFSHPKYSFLKKSNLYGFLVKGDSMLPRFRNNDLLITTLYNNIMPRDRDVVVVNFKSNIDTSSGAVKLFYWSKKNKTDFILNSINSYYPPTHHSLEEVINFFKVHLSISSVDYKYQ